MSQTRRHWFGAHLAGLRRARRLSQRQVANKVCALSGVQSVTRNDVSRWERGARIPTSWLPVLAEVLDVLLADLENAAAYARGEVDELPGARQAPPTTTGAPLPSVLEGQHGDMAAMESFRWADRKLGGGHLYEAVVRYLNSQVAPRIFGTTSVSSAPDTFLAASALTEMAGWMAHDSGQDVRARQHFEHALSLARVGSDQALTAHIYASLSHLALQSGDPGQAVDLARAGRDVSEAGAFTPVLGARLYAMEARALARLGETVSSHQAMEAAEDSLGRRAEVPASAWISKFDAASLASETALCLKDLGRLSVASQAAERAVALRAGDRARSRVFGQITLAIIRAEMGELDEACTVASTLLESCRTLGSLRVSRQLGDLSRTLRPFQSEPSVAEILDSLAVINRQRDLLLAGIASSYSEGNSP